MAEALQQVELGKRGFATASRVLIAPQPLWVDQEQAQCAVAQTQVDDYFGMLRYTLEMLDQPVADLLLERLHQKTVERGTRPVNDCGGKLRREFGGFLKQPFEHLRLRVVGAE
ncbi:hypothetical protein D3C85_1026470 [compost metagenome]